MRAAILLLLAALALPSQQTSRVEGVILRSEAESGVENVRVLLARQGAEARSGYATVTDGNGRFILNDVTAGTYRLFADLQGFAREETTVEVTAGQNRSDIKLRVVPLATISGRVYDEGGRPKARVQVQLLQRRYTPNGRQIAQMIANDTTNDLGEYRMYWVTPGSYYVSATPNPTEIPRESYLDIADQSGAPTGVFLPMFYPNAYGTDGAEAVTLAPGAEVRGIDFAMSRVRSVRVEGLLVDGNGQLLPKTDVSLHPQRGGWADLSTIQGAATNDKGEFVFRQVPSGSYTMSAANNDLLGGRLASTTEIHIGDKNVSALRVVLFRAAAVSGRVVVEAGAPQSQIGSITFEAIGTGADSGVGIETDGTFTATSLFHGVFRVVINAREGYFASAARSGSRNVLREGLDTRVTAIEPLEIQVGYTTAEIQGSVTTAEGQPAGATQVVLIPNTERALRTDLYRRTTTDASGRYSIKGAAPGDYKLFAWEKIDPFGYFDPALMELYETRGTPVRIIRNQGVSVNLRSLP